VEYPSWKIWLAEAEEWLLSDGLTFYTEGFLIEGRAGSGVFSEKLDFKTFFFAFRKFATVILAEVNVIMVCSDYYEWR
jgi:hypothetical protein